MYYSRSPRQIAHSGAESHRVWSEPMTLAAIADKVVATHINLTG